MIPAVVGSIIKVGALTHCSLLYSVLSLKVAQINVQCSLIWKFMLNKFKVGDNDTKATKNICGVKVHHSTVIRGFKKFCSGGKNHNSQTRSDRHKTGNSKTVIQATEANLMSRTLRVSGMLGISQSSEVYNHNDLNKSIESC